MQPTCQIGERLRLEPANFFTDGYGLVRSAAEINTAGRDLRFPVPDANCCAAGLAGATKKTFTGFAIYCEWEMTPEKWSVWNQILPNQENQH